MPMKASGAFLEALGDVFAILELSLLQPRTCPRFGQGIGDSASSKSDARRPGRERDLPVHGHGSQDTRAASLHG
jgi:hypothetical protein